MYKNLYEGENQTNVSGNPSNVLSIGNNAGDPTELNALGKYEIRLTDTSKNVQQSTTDFIFDIVKRSSKPKHPAHVFALTGIKQRIMYKIPLYLRELYGDKNAQLYLDYNNAIIETLNPELKVQAQKIISHIVKICYMEQINYIDPTVLSPEQKEEIMGAQVLINRVFNQASQNYQPPSQIKGRSNNGKLLLSGGAGEAAANHNPIKYTPVTFDVPLNLSTYLNRDGDLTGRDILLKKPVTNLILQEETVPLSTIFIVIHNLSLIPKHDERKRYLRYETNLWLKPEIPSNYYFIGNENDSLKNLSTLFSGAPCGIPLLNKIVGSNAGFDRGSGLWVHGIEPMIAYLTNACIHIYSRIELHNTCLLASFEKLTFIYIKYTKGEDIAQLISEFDEYKRASVLKFEENRIKIYDSLYKIERLITNPPYGEITYGTIPSVAEYGALGHIDYSSYLYSPLEHPSMGLKTPIIGSKSIQRVVADGARGIAGGALWLGGASVTGVGSLVYWIGPEKILGMLSEGFTKTVYNYDAFDTAINDICFITNIRKRAKYWWENTTGAEPEREAYSLWAQAITVLGGWRGIEENDLCTKAGVYQRDPPCTASPQQIFNDEITKLRGSERIALFSTAKLATWVASTIQEGFGIKCTWQMYLYLYAVSSYATSLTKIPMTITKEEFAILKTKKVNGTIAGIWYSKLNALIDNLIAEAPADMKGGSSKRSKSSSLAGAANAAGVPPPPAGAGNAAGVPPPLAVVAKDFYDNWEVAPTPTTPTLELVSETSNEDLHAAAAGGGLMEQFNAGWAAGNNAVSAIPESYLQAIADGGLRGWAEAKKDRDAFLLIRAADAAQRLKERNARTTSILGAFTVVVGGAVACVPGGQLVGASIMTTGAGLALQGQVQLGNIPEEAAKSLQPVIANLATFGSEYAQKRAQAANSTKKLRALKEDMGKKLDASEDEFKAACDKLEKGAAADNFKNKGQRQYNMIRARINASKDNIWQTEAEKVDEARRLVEELNKPGVLPSIPESTEAAVNEQRDHIVKLMERTKEELERIAQSNPLMKNDCDMKLKLIKEQERFLNPELLKLLGLEKRGSMLNAVDANLCRLIGVPPDLQPSPLIWIPNAGLGMSGPGALPVVAQAAAAPPPAVAFSAPNPPGAAASKSGSGAAAAAAAFAAPNPGAPAPAPAPAPAAAAAAGNNINALKARLVELGGKALRQNTVVALKAKIAAREAMAAKSGGSRKMDRKTKTNKRYHNRLTLRNNRKTMRYTRK